MNGTFKWIASALLAIVLAIGGYSFSALASRVNVNEDTLNNLRIERAQIMEEYRQVVKQFNHRLDVLEDKQNQILARLDRIHPSSQAPQVPQSPKRYSQ